MGDIFIPNSPMDRMAEAAKSGNPKKMQAMVPQVKHGVNELAAAADDDDLLKAAEAAGYLGIPILESVAEIIPYITATKAGISIVNGIAGIVAAVALREDEETTVRHLGLPGNEFLFAAIKVKAKLKKENKGWEIGENFEDITELSVVVESLEGSIMDSLNLQLEITGIGVGQDSINVSLKVDESASDGSGPPTPMTIRKSVDGPGFVAKQDSGFVRTGCKRLSIVAGSTARVEYGVNGANVAIVLEVSGVATVFGQPVQLKKVTVLDIGASL